MPLLPSEPCLVPEDLFDRPSDDGSARWWVAHTRPRAEKSLARKLPGAGVPFYLPQYEHRRRSAGRTLTSFLPLFPGYVFVVADADHYSAVLRTDLVVRMLPVEDQGRLAYDLRRVHLLITSGEPLNPEVGWAPGLPVEVVAGPLAGLTGTVVRRGTQARILVEVQLLRQGVSVEVEAWMIRPRTKVAAHA
jgi:transcriptional antiterminator RfaH